MTSHNRYTPQEITGRQPSAAALIASTIALLLIVAGTMMPLFNHGQGMAFRYVYAAGAVILLLARLFSPYTGKVTRARRLTRIEAWSAIFFCVAAFFMFYDTTTSRDWLAFTLAGGAIQIYTSIMIPRTLNRALQGKE
jgi:hypothetical protein